MADLGPVLDDLRAESAELDALVAELPPPDWAKPTPAPGWTIAHQIAHLAWADEASVISGTDTDRWQELTLQALEAPQDFIDQGAERGVTEPPAGLLARWREGREALQGMLRRQPPGVRMPWYGPPLSTGAMATGRLMETWAHGKDIADALGVRREPTARLEHVARMGVRTRDFAYAMNGQAAPAEEFRVELTGPGGELWAFGPEDAAQRVTGPAVDFCLVAVQRVHRADTALVAEGDDAEAWLGIAQAFAGPPGEGRKAGM